MTKQKEYEQLVKGHYARPTLSEDILAAIEKAGKQINSYKDTAAFDEFHMRGRMATRELAQLAQMQQGQHVLDLGCGLGGPSRLLAAEFGCTVTGIDLMDEFIDAAEMLAQQTGLADQVTFQKCNMLAMPFKENLFDAAWSLHTLMNIEDKAGLFAEVSRVLKPGGTLALYEIVAGNKSPVVYPVQWASDPSINFLLPEDDLKKLATQAGFEVLVWQDVTQTCLQWFQAAVEKMSAQPGRKLPPVGLHLVIGPSMAEKAKNTALNMKADRIRVAYGLFRKTPP